MTTANEKLDKDVEEAVIAHILRYELFRHETLSNQIDKALGETPIGHLGNRRANRSTWNIIWYLCRSYFLEETPSVSDIYLSTGLSKGTVISHISSLSDAGVISKLSNAQDRRRVCITFTRQFQAILSDYKFRCLNDFGDHIVPKGEDDLRHRAEQAEIANHSKTTLLANMGHDLRVPLNSIIGFCEMMQGGVKGQIQPPEYLEYIGDIHAAAGQLVNLVNDIIDLSQVELTGSLPLKPVVVSPDLIIAECLRMIRPFAESKEIRIITKDSPELPGLYVDPLRLRQILLNLISNAAKFTPPGGRVTVSTHMNDQGGVCLSVADTGQGIAETELDAAMELFRRGAVAESQIEGAGLGLSIAKALVELHGGWISIESREAKGTTVTVNFPPSRTR